ncbi:hypothetical protein BCR33DRAFT_848336 [Rhizoclosmatium globosum]|uniref:DisA/LigA helix-hairpin-helix motif domain-containing protein n=1 Tax=Rhizoclosmatium globosum TaxID=329046 RepID=A0A1Y2CMS6_9FUNG|nr:hypothetical protein BCR33DRAFT_848336 [Rhizoclosmatium globosum]|eukprot:ORY48330.1 hypothetical protein BCR33DRAFT_848336 [Rhizoclosmatium globosum]
MIHTITIAAHVKGSALATALSNLPSDQALRVIVSPSASASASSDTRPTFSDIDLTLYPGCGLVFVPLSMLGSCSIDSFVDRFCLLKEKKVGIVVVEVDKAKWDHFVQLQQSVLVEFGLRVLPVESVDQAARYISRIIYQEAKPPKQKTNVAAATGKTDNKDALLIKTVAGIPGIGEAKAKELLVEFKTLVALSQATDTMISSRIRGIGPAQAKKVVAFFKDGKEFS